jgi:catechol 2,3-dioxygenase-like lactoylglutathione lyase family enzyme
MYLTHIKVTMPRAGESVARDFYGGILGLREIVKPEPLKAGAGVWFDVGGLELRISVEEHRASADTQRHFGLACCDVDRLKAKIQAAGAVIEEGPKGPRKRFFVRDPFGNRIEIHSPGGLHAGGCDLSK